MGWSLSWKDIGKTISSIAPGIATAIGGPAGAAASLGVKALCGALGISDDAKPKEIAKAVANMTPEAALALKKAENDFLVRMKELEVDVFKIEADDRANARDREKSVGSFDTRMLAIAFVVTFIVVLLGVLFTDSLKSVDQVKLSIVSMLIGGLVSKVNTIIEYFFGGSKGHDVMTAKFAENVKSFQG